MTGKAQQKKNETALYLEIRLQEWAQWCRWGEQTGLGYPSQSTLHLFREGKVIDRTKGQRWEPEQASAEEFEGWVLLLSKTYPLEAQTLRDYYAHHQPKDSLAKAYGVSVRTIESRLQAAKLWLEGCLIGRNN